MEIVISIVPKLAAFLTTVFVFLSSIFTPYASRMESMESVTEIEDGLYIMDCTYDYDSMDILEHGVSNAVALIAGGLKTVFTGSKGFACTTFNSVTPDGDYLLSRNFDYMDSPSLIVRTTPSEGFASISTCSLYFFGYELDSDFRADDTKTNILTLLAPYICLDGINEKGFSIGVLELETDPTVQISLKKDLTTTTMIRACLDHAATVEEALEIFRTHDMRDLIFDGCKYHFQMSDAEGNSAIVEYADNEMYILYPEEKEENVVNFQAATNFHLVEGIDDPLGMGQDRYETVMTALTASKGVTTEREAMQLLNAAHVKDEDMHGYICSTLWSNVFNNTDKTVSVCYFGNYEKTYTFSVNDALLSQMD